MRSLKHRNLPIPVLLKGFGPPTTSFHLFDLINWRKSLNIRPPACRPAKNRQNQRFLPCRYDSDIKSLSIVAIRNQRRLVTPGSSAPKRCLTGQANLSKPAEVDITSLQGETTGSPPRNRALPIVRDPSSGRAA